MITDKKFYSDFIYRSVTTIAFLEINNLEASNPLSEECSYLFLFILIRDSFYVRNITALIINISFIIDNVSRYVDVSASSGTTAGIIPTDIT